MAKKRKSAGAAATPAIAACAEAGITHEVHSFESGTDHFGDHAAEALAHQGVVPDRIFKTLVVEINGGTASRPQLAVAVLPVPHRLSLKKVASALGAAKAEMADPSKAERSSGYVTGGISPIAQKKALPTVVDASALEHETVFIAGGKRGLDIELRGADLAALTDAVIAEIVA